jgi:L-iditol 2-dehydrogenase
MKACVLEEVEKFRVIDVPQPVPKEDEVLVQVGAVGLCGTDQHIYHGWGNYNLTERGDPIPLTKQPQILGHEFSGNVAAVGSKVKNCRPGDRVVVDQLLNCYSLRRDELCEYCESGDSHLCQYGTQLGITGPPGAFMDYVALPAVNIIPLPSTVSHKRASLIEPLGCVIHACDMVDRYNTRYTFGGKHPVRYILIAGAGPGGLLFLQHIRNIQKFDGEIFVTVRRDIKTEAVKKLGGTPIDQRKVDVVSEIHRLTKGEKIHYFVEATGAADVWEWSPKVMRRQATFMLYGAAGGGHTGRDIKVILPFQCDETYIVTAGGASGGFDADGTPTTYRLAMEHIRDGRINPDIILSHEYTEYSDLQKAFGEDWSKPDFVKGVFVHNNVV